MNPRFSLVIAAGLLLLFLVPVAVWADDPTTNPGMNDDPADSTMKDNMQGKTTENEMIFQSSKLSDLNVYNKDNADKKLGKIDNLIINEHTGHVLFAVLDPGMMKNKVAVPWSALQIRQDPNNKDKFFYVLNKTEDDLKTAPSFDKNNISQVVDKNWQQSVEKFFGVQSVAKPEDLQGSGQLSVSQLIFESSKLSDLNVYNRNDNSMKLGNLDDLIVNAHSGTVQYAVLDTGVGGKKIAVPWDALLMQKEQNKDKYWLTLNKTSDDLKGAPTFNKDQIAQVNDPQWQQTVDQFFGVRMATRPKQ